MKTKISLILEHDFLWNIVQYWACFGQGEDSQKWLK